MHTKNLFLFLSAFAGCAYGQVATQEAWTHLSSKWGDLPAPFSSTQQTACLTVDLDKNGLQDIVLAERTGSPSLVWLRRESNGWTRYPIEFPQLRIEAGGAAYDIDGDGDLDLIFGGDAGSNQVWWWENPYPNFNPEEGWKRRLIKADGGNKHHDQITGDFDGDGKTELVFWNQGASTLLLARIPADPKNAQPWPLTEIFRYEGREMEGLAAADVNGDGKLDIVGGGRWFEHIGGDQFRPHVIDDSMRFARAAAGQLKKEGWAEVAFSVGDNVGAVKWYEHVNGSWVGHTLVEGGVVHGHTLQIADVDRDGNLDIFSAEMGKWIHGTFRPNNPHPRAWIFFGNGQGAFEKRLVARGYGIHEGRLADVDGDGDLDIVAKPYNWDTPRIDVLINNGSPRKAPTPRRLDSWQRHVIDDNKPWRSIFIDSADLDNDGLRDIVTGGWWYRNPGSLGGPWKRTMFGTPFHNFAAFADFDNDGWIDLLGMQGKGSDANPDFVWAKNRGNGTFTLYTGLPSSTGDFPQGAIAIQAGPGPVSIALSWHKPGHPVELLTAPAKPGDGWKLTSIAGESQDEELSAGDIDRDGDQDLLLGTVWLRNDGGGVWSRHSLHTPPGDPDRNRLADINNDGRLDAVVGFEAINKPGKVAWYEQPADPAGPWTEHVIGEVIGPMSLDVADMDGDGDLDLVVGEHNYATPETATLWILENVDGEGKTWKRHTVFTGDEHHDGARLVDIDDDGDLDIISIGWRNPRVAIYENKSKERGTPLAIK